MKIPALAIAWICLCQIADGQKMEAAEYCSKSRKQQWGSMAKVTVADPAEENYDIRHVKLDIALTNQSTEISGNVITTAVVVSPSMSDYIFELTEALTVDSVKINGQLRPFTGSGIIRKVALTTPFTQKSTFTAQVFYHGTAIPGNIFGREGLNTDTAWGSRVTFTMSEPYRAREWWPCKQSLKDKIDSADIWITIPEGLKAGSNGILQTTNPMPGNKRRYQWKTAYPIAYYLISAAVAPYTEYSFYTKLSATDSVLVQNYIYVNPKFLAENRRRIDSTGIMIQFLSGLFGDYPFKKEKYGHCIVPLFGGMEHQTMTTQGDFGHSLTVHELAHQWFGDHVTCATWKDIWLNEGFASYAEYLFEERYRTPAEAYEHMRIFHDRALKAPFAAIYVDDTTNPTRIFDGGLTYSKAAAVIHMLRFVMDNDDKFFELLQRYQQQFAFGNATTEDFRLLAEQVTGLNLFPFFNQWIYKQGHPVYTATWNQVFDRVFIKIRQEGAAPLSQNVFETPLELKLSSAGKDTLVKVEVSTDSQVYYFNWNQTMLGMSIDPGNHILNDVKNITHDGTLGLNEVISNDIIAYPNPSNGDWYVIGLNTDYYMTVTDINGRTLWRQNNGNIRAISIPTATFANGMYILQLYDREEKVKTFKLIKQ